MSAASSASVSVVRRTFSTISGSCSPTGGKCLLIVSAVVWTVSPDRRICKRISLTSQVNTEQKTTATARQTHLNMEHLGPPRSTPPTHPHLAEQFYRHKSLIFKVLVA